MIQQWTETKQVQADNIHWLVELSLKGEELKPNAALLHPKEPSEVVGASD